MEKYKQCDPKWGDKKLGTGTICDRGCTVSCLAMASGVTPDVVVDRCEFTPEGAIYWASTDAIGLDFIWRGYEYDNDRVKEVIDKYGFCLVEVDNSGTTHWVLYIGNQRMIDPLTGRENKTSKYPATGFCILEKKQSVPSDLEICLKQHGELVAECENLKKKIEELKNSASTYKGQRNTARKELSGAKKRIEELEKEIAKKPVKNLSKKILQLLGYYLLPTAVIEYLLVKYINPDPQLAQTVGVTFNIAVYILKQRIEKLLKELELKRGKKIVK